MRPPNVLDITTSVLMPVLKWKVWKDLEMDEFDTNVSSGNQCQISSDEQIQALSDISENLKSLPNSLERSAHSDEW